MALGRQGLCAFPQRRPAAEFDFLSARPRDQASCTRVGGGFMPGELGSPLKAAAELTASARVCNWTRPKARAYC